MYIYQIIGWNHPRVPRAICCCLWEQSTAATSCAAKNAATARSDAPRGKSATAPVLHHQCRRRLTRATQPAAAPRPRRPRQGAAAAPQNDQRRHGRPHPHTSAQGNAHRRRGARRHARGGRGHGGAAPDRHDRPNLPPRPEVLRLVRRDNRRVVVLHAAVHELLPRAVPPCDLLRREVCRRGGGGAAGLPHGAVVAAGLGAGALRRRVGAEEVRRPVRTSIGQHWYREDKSSESMFSETWNQP